MRDWRKCWRSDAHWGEMSAREDVRKKGDRGSRDKGGLGFCLSRRFIAGG
jgi:hypothetical protein